jgi:molybdenum cofactor synthesis domain-containing protein
MYGASVAALTVYDMLKPIDKQIEITSVRLLNKKGGKSDFKEHAPLIRSSVIVCSDSVSSGKKEDKAGRVILERLKVLGLQEPSYVVIADDAELIRSRVVLEREKGTQLLLFTGGTGLSPRDVTPETIRPLLDREIPGVMEAARAYGQERMPHAMLSRGVAGFIGDMLVLTLPGSTRGAEETMDALFPQLLHVFKIVRGAQHDSDK